MALISPTTDIRDLGTLTPQSDQGASFFPIPVPDQFFPNETRARRYERDDDHRSINTPALVTNANGRFTVSYRAKFSGDATTGIHIAQFINAATDGGTFQIRTLSSGRIVVNVYDTTTLQTANDLEARSNNILDLLDGNWHEVTVSADSLASGPENIIIAFDGVDIRNTVGYGTDSVRGGTGVVTFAPTNPDEFTVGNYAEISTTNNSPDFDFGWVQVWDGIALTAQDISDNYDFKQALVIGLLNLDEETEEFINVWCESDPSLRVLNTLTEPFQLGTTLNTADLSGQTLTTDQIAGLNNWALNDPGLAEAGEPFTPFAFGDVLNDAMASSPTVELTNKEINKLNDWANSDPALDSANTITSPFLMGDSLNALLTR